MFPVRALLLVVLAVSPACTPRDESADPDSAASEAHGAEATAAPDSVGTGAPPDTASIETRLADFRASLATAPTALTGSAPSRDALVRGFVAALARSDTAALLAMAIDRAEYAYLIYPESPLMRRPYRQGIDVAWTLQGAAHAKGITRLLRRLGGQPLRYVTHACENTPRVEGRNRYWRECITTIAAGGDTLRGQAFSAIVERDGRFNIVSYSNDF